MKIIRKFLLTFTALTLICVLTLSITGQASAAEVLTTGSCGDSVTYTLYSDGELVISGNGAMQNYSYSYSEPWLDSVSYSYGVSTPWYDYRDSIRKLTIESGVTTIGAYAFSDCSNLTSINIPNSVTSIDICAFSNCCSLTELYIDDFKTWSEVEFYFNPFESNNNPHRLFIGGKLVEGTFIIPNSVTQIPVCAFGNCRDITSIILPNSVTSIGESAFSNCNGLSSITIPDSVTIIGESAFSNCNGLASITIPGSVTSIGSYAFSNCDGLVSITIPNSVTIIGESAFSNCNGLASITIPGSVTSIGSYAFSNCNGLASITIPGSVTGIGSYAFSDCRELTRAVLGTGIPSIPRYLFYNCSKLTQVEIPESVADILIGAFSGTALTDVYYLGTKARWGGTITSPKNEALEQATVHYETEMPKEPVKTHTHTLVHHSAAAAACTETGTGEYWKCEGTDACNKMFSDANGLAEIAEIPTTAATGHSYGAWSITKEPTLTTTGIAERTCGNNNTHKEIVDLPILTDKTVWTEGLKIEPTETENGSVTYTSQYGDVTITIPALNPKYDYSIRYENGKAVVTVPQDGTYTVIFASYDNGILLSMSAQDIQLTRGENSPISPQNFNANGKVKVILWDSLIGMKPLFGFAEQF